MVAGLAPKPSNSTSPVFGPDDWYAELFFLASHAAGLDVPGPFNAAEVLGPWTVQMATMAHGTGR